jgi:hypothetical protein
MSETFSIYLVDEELLPMELSGLSDEEIYAELVAAIEENGELQTMVEMTQDDFIDALESIDQIIEGNRLLPNCAMNNSPHGILDKSSEGPYFGYFSPSQVQELYFMIDSLSDETIDKIESVETHSEVFSEFSMAANEAVKMDYAIAVLHS